MATVCVLGAGLFGSTGALALARRGHRVVLLDPGPIPRPASASADVSKVVRLDYGDDELTTAVMEQALAGWRAWNARWIAAGLSPLFHETGLLVLSRGPLAPGSFEGDSYELLARRGHALQRFAPGELGRQHPAFAAARCTDGYRQPQGGWVESGAVIERLCAECRAVGVELREGCTVSGWSESGGSRLRLHLQRGGNGNTAPGLAARAGTLEVDGLVVAAGAWLPGLLPELAGAVTTAGQPVLLLAPADPRPFRAPLFPVFTADIATTGLYGFPALPDGRVKIARHGRGLRMHPDEPRELPAEVVAELRALLAETIPALADAAQVGGRLCLYADTRDGQFLIDAVPGRRGVTVAGGDSGHAFKFAPILGELVAGALERALHDGAHAMAPHDEALDDAALRDSALNHEASAARESAVSSRALLAAFAQRLRWRRAAGPSGDRARAEH